MRVRKVAFPAVMLGVSLYILLPTADEIVIHPVLGLFFSYMLNIPFVYGVLLSVVVYRGIGVTCLLDALLTGGKPIYNKLKEKFKRKTAQQQPTANSTTAQDAPSV
jgi:hypothetical protein